MNKVFYFNRLGVTDTIYAAETILLTCRNCGAITTEDDIQRVIFNGEDIQELTDGHRLQILKNLDWQVEGRVLCPCCSIKMGDGLVRAELQ